MKQFFNIKPIFQMQIAVSLSQVPKRKANEPFQSIGKKYPKEETFISFNSV